MPISHMGNASRPPGLSPGCRRTAVTVSVDTWWGAGGPPPQWIEVDLGAPYEVARIRLSISQDPNGRTVHQVWGRAAGEDARLLFEFDDLTEGDQVLEYAPPEPWERIQFIRIETVTSPSWVSWHEIEVLTPWPARRRAATEHSISTSR